ncbi:PH domain-containing protein [Natrarchaeobaculum aegyptiacum]|uniref:PH domain-containing protein n=1 Tax=Natrarchaeobaculum aegyptiacum TaxID=745377 RepID=UPI000A3D6BA0|nr:PH domain-containing protein [Natrarchaeobaculum aegyptiacum]
MATDTSATAASAAGPASDDGASVDTADLEWLSLDGGEEVVWAGGPDRRTLLPAFLIGIPLSIVLIGLLIIASEYLRVTNTWYVVTDRALYRKTGILSRDVKRIEHEKVQDISYSQSALGTHFGYGTVEISTAGGSGVEMAFQSVPEPRAVQHLISERVDRGRDDEPGEERPDDVLADILVELQEIRTLLERQESSSDRPDAGTDGGRTTLEWTEDDAAGRADGPSEASDRAAGDRRSRQS